MGSGVAAIPSSCYPVQLHWGTCKGHIGMSLIRVPGITTQLIPTSSGPPQGDHRHLHTFTWGLWPWLPYTKLRPSSMWKVAPGAWRCSVRAGGLIQAPVAMVVLGWDLLVLYWWAHAAWGLCRIESYSCKMAGDDKHMFKQFCQEGQPHVLEALSPPQTTGISPSRYHGDAGHGQRRVCGGRLGFTEGMTLVSLPGCQLCLFLTSWSD